MDPYLDLIPSKKLKMKKIAEKDVNTQHPL